MSALLSPAGNEALIVLAIHQRFLRPCFLKEIAAEYAAVLARPKFGFAPDEVDSLIVMFREKGECVEPRAFAVKSPDPQDTKFLHCALTVDADFIVTGNKRHFPDSPYGTTRVSNAGGLLELITREI